VPELPDIDVYIAALERKIRGRRLESVRTGNPFLVRSVAPPLRSVHGHTVTALRRIGKRIAIGFDNELWLILHLMIAGRLHWKATPPSLAAKQQLAALDFEDGSLLLTEAGTRKRASLFVVEGAGGIAEHDPGGIEPLECSIGEFAAAMRRENHTLKRALTDPHILSGIGNAYSDEILHGARLSPVLLTQRLDEEQLLRLYAATRTTLSRWRDQLMREAGGEMPARVTAFRDGMAVHGRYGQPCPACAQPVQRVRYKDNETNYCAACQTGGRLLRDRSLSRLLKQDWPRTLDDL
jgi:formamidopyrimidine-DNA glycosylase